MTPAIQPAPQTHNQAVLKIQFSRVNKPIGSRLGDGVVVERVRLRPQRYNSRLYEYHVRTFGTR